MLLPARLRPSDLKTDYTQTFAVFPGTWRKIGVVLGIAVLIAAPWLVSDKWGIVFVDAGIAVTAAIGLNILTGYTGQVSLGHAAFLGIGAYTAAYLTGDRDWPFLVSMLAAGLVAMAVGALIGPAAFRLKGLYLSIVTIGLVFIAEYVFNNLDAITGGVEGRPGPAPEILGFELNVPFLEQDILGVPFDRTKRYYYLAVLLAIAGGLFAKNIARSRSGRGFQAVRDREISAGIVGIDVRRAKMSAFMVSSFYAGVAGALFGAWVRTISPEVSFNLIVSIEFVAMIIIGGIGTVWGAVVGAIFVKAIPTFVDSVATSLPFVESSGTVGPFDGRQVSQIIYGIVLILFLLFEPLGLYGIWLRVRAYFETWPFRY